MKTVCSIRAISRKMNVSHTAILQSIREGRECEGIDYRAAAVQSPEGVLKGILLEDLHVGVKDAPKPSKENPNDSERSVLHRSAGQWPWAQSIEDIIQGKPVLGCVYKVQHGTMVSRFGELNAFKQQSLYALIAEKMRSGIFAMTLDLIITTVTPQGTPLAIPCAAMVQGGTTQLHHSDLQWSVDRVPL